MKNSASIFNSEELINAITSFLISSPIFLGIIICSYISGYAWCFLIVTYIKAKNKGNMFIRKMSGNIVLGFLWFTLIHVPIHWILVGSQMNISNILDHCAYDILYVFFIQTIILISVLMFKKEK